MDAMPTPALTPASAAPRRRPRLIATDLDGTVIGYRHTRSGRLSPRTVAALRQAHDAGVVVVFVTGRPLRWLGALGDQLGPVGPVICSNGAVVVDVATGAVLRSHPMERVAVWGAVERMRGVDPTATFGAETLEGFFWERAFAERSAFQDGVEAAETLEAVLPDEATVVKLMARSDTLEPDAFLAAARDALGELVNATHSAPGVALVEMAAPGVHKAATLAEHAAERGIAPEDVVAFGDMPNDVEMLTWAGLGCAVASGHASLLAAADVVVGACDDDGVAVAIEELLALPAE